MKKIVYIPVEVAKREVLPKSFLAAFLANKGCTVYLFEDYIFDRFGYPGPGIYLGKNVFKTEVPYSLEYYDSLKQNGIHLYYLDEEGGVYPGTFEDNWRKIIVARTDPNSFSVDDHYLSWGSWQATLYNELSKAQVHITGSPNYEICKPKYKQCLEAVDKDIRNSCNNYILVNTRFNLANPMKGLGSFFGENSPSSKNITDDFYISLVAADFQYLGKFIELLLVLAMRFDNIPIVIRPHPTENHDFYRKIFYGMKNVVVNGDGHISSWVRAASVIIHNGCSTALQAVFAEKPVITYLPTAAEVVGPTLPNAVGWRATSSEEVIALVGKAIRGELQPLVGCDINSTVASVDSFDVIAELISRSNICGNENNLVLKIIALKIGIKFSVRWLIGRDISFDYEEFDRVPSYVGAARDYLSADIKASRICSGIYKVELNK